MKIIIEQERIEDEFDEVDTFNYDMKALFTIPDDATATEAVGAFYKALKAAGYAENSIVEAMANVADYYYDDDEVYELEPRRPDLECDPDGFCCDPDGIL